MTQQTRHSDSHWISTDIGHFDLDVIHGFLKTAYWCTGIPRETVERAMRNSLAFGVFTESGAQIGYARVISDKATFAYLADVFILEPHRGKGLSKWLIATVLDHPELQGLRRWLLATRDAHGLYRSFGFVEGDATRLMQITRPNLYAKRE